jgi:DNA-binding CsgD family transcriptional regulator
VFVQRDSLEAQLASGKSFEQIGRELGRDGSTIAYWAQKYGLYSATQERHRSKGGIPRDRLRVLVDEGLSTRGIAERLGLSQGTIRHWLRRHGLKTQRSGPPRARGERGRDPNRRYMECMRHGRAEFWLESRGIYRCVRCRSEAVSRRRRRVKEILVAEAGGCCSLCGYDRCIAALQFHHLDGSTKVFGLAERGFTRGIEVVRAEAAKCILLCSNCHAEVEAGIVKVGPHRYLPR